MSNSNVQRVLPAGVFLSFDSILKSFFSSSVKNALSSRSGQHPSTVFTLGPFLLTRVLSLTRSLPRSQWQPGGGGAAGGDGGAGGGGLWLFLVSKGSLTLVCVCVWALC